MIIAIYWLFAFYAVWTLTRKHRVSPFTRNEWEKENAVTLSELKKQ
jgi:hypothetical protein